VIRAAIARAEEAIIATLLAAMTLITFIQVILRYVFNGGFLWALEATTYLFAWLVLTGISYGVRINAHIGVDLVVRAVPAGQARRALGLLGIALCLLYAALMLYGATVYIEKMHVLGVDAEDIPVPRWLLGIILPIGFGLLFIRFAEVGWAILRRQRDSVNLADEAGDAIRELGGKDDGGARP
jgi:C4-dicarboxylate transporter DctQ subunit